MSVCTSNKTSPGETLSPFFCYFLMLKNQKFDYLCVTLPSFLCHLIICPSVMVGLNAGILRRIGSAIINHLKLKIIKIFKYLIIT